MPEHSLDKQIEAILHATEFLLDDAELNIKQRELLEIITRNVEAMQDAFDESTVAAGVDAPDASHLRHTLGNMLTPIRGYAQVLQMDSVGTLSPLQRTAMEAICTVADDMREHLIYLKTQQTQQMKAVEVAEAAAV